MGKIDAVLIRSVFMRKDLALPLYWMGVPNKASLEVKRALQMKMMSTFPKAEVISATSDGEFAKGLAALATRTDDFGDLLDYEKDVRILVDLVQRWLGKARTVGVKSLVVSPAPHIMVSDYACSPDGPKKWKSRITIPLHRSFPGGPYQLRVDVPVKSTKVPLDVNVAAYCSWECDLPTTILARSKASRRRR